MRAVLVLALLAVTALAGCATDSPRPELRAFTAIYEDNNGYRFRVELRGPEPVLGPDGALHDAYILATRSEEEGGERWGESLEALGPDLRPVRRSGCYAMTDAEASCHHMHMDFVPFFDVADWGVGYPMFLDGERDGKLLRIPDPRVDPAADPEARSLFEYRIGELWPQRYLRSAPAWDFEETLLQLVDAEVGDPLPAIAPWPASDIPGPVAAVDDLYPGAEDPLLDLPFTVADAVAELRRNDVARAAVDGACIVGVQAWADRPMPDPLVPPVSVSSNVGEVQLETLDREGMRRTWSVWRERDALGRETMHVDGGHGGADHSRFTCAEREAAQVSFSAFLAIVPDGIERGRLSGVSIDWSPDHAGRPPRATYTVQYEPEGGAHWRSATMHAGTGQWARFSYLAGDPLDPENNG